MLNLPQTEHLGDGAYISFDGYQFWLAVNHHENKVVAIGFREIDMLNDFVRRTKGVIDEYRERKADEASGNVEQ